LLWQRRKRRSQRQPVAGEEVDLIRQRALEQLAAKDVEVA
jgi:hypothetical protein